MKSLSLSVDMSDSQWDRRTGIIAVQQQKEDNHHFELSVLPTSVTVNFLPSMSITFRNYDLGISGS